jgi:FixJ family two-component response regulator
LKPVWVKPQRSGLELLSRVAASSTDVPVVVLT